MQPNIPTLSGVNSNQPNPYYDVTNNNANGLKHNDAIDDHRCEIQLPKPRGIEEVADYIDKYSQDFMKNPQSLSCGHIHDEETLNIYYSKTKQRNVYPICPTCEQEYSSSYPQRYLANRIKEYITEINQPQQNLTQALLDLHEKLPLRSKEKTKMYEIIKLFTEGNFEEALKELSRLVMQSDSNVYDHANSLLDNHVATIKKKRALTIQTALKEGSKNGADLKSVQNAVDTLLSLNNGSSQTQTTSATTAISKDTTQLVSLPSTASTTLTTTTTNVANGTSPIKDPLKLNLKKANKSPSPISPTIEDDESRHGIKNPRTDDNDVLLSKKRRRLDSNEGNDSESTAVPSKIVNSAGLLNRVTNPVTNASRQDDQDGAFNFDRTLFDMDDEEEATNPVRNKNQTSAQKNQNSSTTTTSPSSSISVKWWNLRKTDLSNSTPTKTSFTQALTSSSEESPIKTPLSSSERMLPVVKRPVKKLIFSSESPTKTPTPSPNKNSLSKLPIPNSNNGSPAKPTTSSPEKSSPAKPTTSSPEKSSPVETPKTSKKSSSKTKETLIDKIKQKKRIHWDDELTVESVKIRDEYDNTPFHHLVRHYSAQTVRQGILLNFIKFDVDLNAKNKKGNTPLHLAVKLAEKDEDHSVDWIKLLLKNGARKDIVNESGKTPFAYAKTDRIKWELKH